MNARHSRDQSGRSYESDPGDFGNKGTTIPPRLTTRPLLEDMATYPDRQDENGVTLNKLLKITPNATLGRTGTSASSSDEFAELHRVFPDGWLVTTVIAAEMRGRLEVPYDTHWGQKGIEGIHAVIARGVSSSSAWSFGSGLDRETIQREVTAMTTPDAREKNPDFGQSYERTRIALEAPYPELLMGLQLVKLRNAVNGAIATKTVNDQSFDGVHATLLVLDTIRYVTAEPLFKLKQLLRVPRPFDTNQWKPAVTQYMKEDDLRPFPRHRSYPAGHPTLTFAVARVLGALLGNPSEPKLTELSDRIMRGRYMAGLHTPTDLKAGRELGTFIGDFMVACAKDEINFPSWHAVFARAGEELN